MTHYVFIEGEGCREFPCLSSALLCCLECALAGKVAKVDTGKRVVILC